MFPLCKVVLVDVYSYRLLNISVIAQGALQLVAGAAAVLMAPEGIVETSVVGGTEALMGAFTMPVTPVRGH
jgi:hypothetical protein